MRPPLCHLRTDNEPLCLTDAARGVRLAVGLGGTPPALHHALVVDMCHVTCPLCCATVATWHQDDGLAEVLTALTENERIRLNLLRNYIEAHPETAESQPGLRREYLRAMNRLEAAANRWILRMRMSPVLA